MIYSKKKEYIDFVNKIITKKDVIIKDNKVYLNGEVIAEYKDSRGGARAGAGRKKVSNGVRHYLVVPYDIDLIIKQRGKKWMWDTLRKVIDSNK